MTRNQQERFTDSGPLDISHSVDMNPDPPSSILSIEENNVDATLLSCAAAEALGIEGPVTRIRATSLAGTTCKITSEVNFAVQSLDDDHQLQVEKAYTLE
ncbi:unnamed protein product [Echinostoma caproni]|uniref:Uncharacterized protein n=1 Tax=Echinostoma caproni TaxID=27848 RepID=A0A183BB19_9TREM|nr:unnamed protein product [Echinostoma caproni]